MHLDLTPLIKSITGKRPGWTFDPGLYNVKSSEGCLKLFRSVQGELTKLKYLFWGLTIAALLADSSDYPRFWSRPHLMMLACLIGLPITYLIRYAAMWGAYDDAKDRWLQTCDPTERERLASELQQAEKGF